MDGHLNPYLALVFYRPTFLSRPHRPPKPRPQSWDTPLPVSKRQYTPRWGLQSQLRRPEGSALLAWWVTLPATSTMGTAGYLHAAVRHGHGIVSQRVAGYLTVVGAGSRCKDIARTDVVWIHRIAPPEGPAGQVQEQHITASLRTPGDQATRGQGRARSHHARMPTCCLGPAAHRGRQLG